MAERINPGARGAFGFFPTKLCEKIDASTCRQEFGCGAISSLFEQFGFFKQP
jgi:hypothetical protein